MREVGAVGEMGTVGEVEERAPIPLRVPLLLFSATVLWSVLLGILQGVIPGLGSLSLGLVALAFIYLPSEHLWRAGIDPDRFALKLSGLRAALSLVARVSLIVFPLYLIAFHGWQQSQGRSLELSTLRMMKWGEEFRAAPPLKELAEGEVRGWGRGDQLTFSWRLLPGERSISLSWREPAGAAGLRWSGGSRGVRGALSERPGGGKELSLSGATRGWGRLRGAGRAGQLSVEIDGKPLRGDRLRLGALRSAREPPVELTRSAWWILSTLLIQLFLVAYPEEFFYRGYLQPIIGAWVGRRRRLWGADFNWGATLLTSALFALAHLATIPHPGRLAVFFPSLLFGWLRAKSGGILAPMIFHALCNLLLQLVAPLYSA